jgi:thiol-disulfide isomerase/thioredoxin
MKAMWLALITLAALAQAPAVPPPGSGQPPVDARDHQPLLLGEASAEQILAHRAVFRENAAKMRVPASLRNRWEAIHTPVTLVAVFGSWCGDSQYHLPGLLTLASEPNPFIDIHFLGVDRDKKLDPAQWPAGCAPQVVARVPTFYLFKSAPGGRLVRVGTIVENPPRPSQTMAEALVDLVESAAAAP